MSTTDSPRTRVSYPPHWEADVVLSDGGTVHLRPIRPADRQALLDLHSRMSMRTRYLRYFGPYPHMSERDVARFSHVDHHDRVALVAELGDDVIAVGRYERLTNEDGVKGDAAEVAFVVEDAHQGRGLGSILLEHLAAAARERGLRQFVAEILAENVTMVRVFRDAGYQIKRALDSGVLHLEFAIDPTERSVAVAQAREQAAEARSVYNLLHPRSVAVIGASADPNKVGNAVLRNLLGGDFAGPVYPVNSEARSVNGVRAYPSVLEIPDEVDLAVVAVPATNVDEVLDQCLAKGVHALVVVTSGFGETGPRGAAAELALVRQARAHGMRVVGPNALGVANTDPEVRLNATLGATVPGSGRVGFFAQSGALGIALLATAAERGLGLSTFVSAGNRADVSGNDLLQYWQTDPATDVVLLYLESFGNPRKFARLARRLAREKPIVVVRSGRHLGTALQLKTPASAVPVDEASVNALFEQAGVIRVESVAQLFDTALVLAHQPLPSGDRVAVVGNSTALGVLAADTALAQGLTLAGDPVDVGAAASPQEFAAAVSAVLGRDDVDALVVVYVPPVAVPGTAYARALREAMASASIPVVSTFLAAEGVPAELAVPGPGGFPGVGSVPSYPSPERAVIALARVVRYAQWRRRPVGQFVRPEGLQSRKAVELAAACMQAAATTRAAAARSEGAPGAAGTPGAPEPEESPASTTHAAEGAGEELVQLNDERTRELLDCYGISVVESLAVDSAEGALKAAGTLGWPVVLKAPGARGWKLSELTGVRLDLHSEEAVRAAYADLAANAPQGVIVQRMVPKGRGCVIAVTEDPSFGAVISFGLAGVVTDLLGDRAYRSVPLSDVDAALQVREPRAAPLLSGYGGSEPVDLGALEDLLLRVSALVEDLPMVRALALEPVIATPDGAEVVSAWVQLGPAHVRADAGPRRLR